MSETLWISVCGLHLVLLSFAGSQLTDSLYKDSVLYEGSPCRLKDGTKEGVCVKAVNCPEVVTRIQKGDYELIRCGFSNFDQIICCAKTALRIENRIRPADFACERYKEFSLRNHISNSKTPLLLFNGVPAKVNEYPHMAALGYAASDDEEDAIDGMKYLCGGTLISWKHVITAAHCVVNIHGLVPIGVVLGKTDLTVSNLNMGQHIPISRIIKHPQYKKSLNYHDIAILKLRHNALISTSVLPTCLMTKPSPTESRSPRLVILGWGATDLTGTTTSMKLLEAGGLKFVDSKECAKIYKISRGIPNGLDDGMICAVDADGVRKADTCLGDSGGPLQIGLGIFPPLVGITSFGQPCGGTTPGVYVSIYHYLDWIEEQVWPDVN